MIITQKLITDTLSGLVQYSDLDVLSASGFQVLADWSEQQEWWHDFAKMHHLGQNWQNSPLGDPYVFALMLFRFVMNSESGVLTTNVDSLDINTVR